MYYTIDSFIQSLEPIKHATISSKPLKIKEMRLQFQKMAPVLVLALGTQKSKCPP